MGAQPTTHLETLKRRSQFLAVAATKKKWVAPHFILQIGDKVEARKETEVSVLCGFTTSSKIGNAVVRNRARRRLRVLAREILVPHANTQHDFVLIGRVTTGTAPFDAMRQDLVKGLKRLQLWRD